jgi:hypothetical protein
VASSSGANSMLQFRFKKEGGGTKHCRKMKQKQRAHLGLIGRKRDTVRRCDDGENRILNGYYELDKLF